MLNSVQNIVLREEVGAEVLAIHWNVERFVDRAVRCDLTEHLHGVKPRFDVLKAKLIIDFSHGNALNLNESSVSLCSDLLPFA